MVQSQTRLLKGRRLACLLSFGLGQWGTLPPLQPWQSLHSF